MTSPTSAARVAGGAGWLGGRAFALLALARLPRKPLHPRGSVHRARLTRHGAGDRTGAAFLDGVGDDAVEVRLSRSVGLPPAWPDVNGLAIRVPGPDGEHGDLLLSTTGRGRLTRYGLWLSRSATGGFFGTLVPYRTPSGPVHVGARHRGARRFGLVWARPDGPWQAFADLDVAGEPELGPDREITFDAILNTPEGLTNYDWYARLRAPSYAAARRVRARRGVHS